jgi:outer membrane protein assembly factor BamB
MKKTMIYLTLIMGIIFTATGETGKPDPRYLDWPYFRGPDRNAMMPDMEWDPMAIKDPKKVKWQIRIGRGYSSVTVKDNFVYAMGLEKKDYTVYGLDFVTGREIWRHKSPGWNYSQLGSYASPTIDGNRVYAFFPHGGLFCIDRLTGAEIWGKNICKEYKIKVTHYGFASSPYIDGEVMYLNAGTAGLCLNKNTGALIWSNGGELAGYSTPVLFTDAGAKKIALLGAKDLFILEATTGKKIKSYPWPTWDQTNTVNPVIFDDNRKIFISSAYDMGAVLLDMSGNGFKEIWRNKNMQNHIDTCLLIDGYFYGNDGDTNKKRGCFRCLDAKTGKLMWTTPNVGVGFVMAVGNKLILLSEKAKIYIIEANPKEYREIVQADILQPSCHIPPVFVRGFLFVRDSKGDLVCIDMNKKA